MWAGELVFEYCCVGDEEVVIERVSGWVVVDVGGQLVVMVVVWSV